MMMFLVFQLLIDDYRTIPLAEVATTRLTHVCVVASVTYVRKQQDGDIHVTVEDATTKVVLEIIPLIPLPRPKKGTTIKACGVTRYDKWHKWHELHPLTSWALIK